MRKSDAKGVAVEGGEGGGETNNTPHGGDPPRPVLHQAPGGKNGYRPAPRDPHRQSPDAALALALIGSRNPAGSGCLFAACGPEPALRSAERLGKRRNRTPLASAVWQPDAQAREGGLSKLRM